MVVRTTPLYDLSGPEFATAFQAGQAAQSSLETAEAQRQRALEESIRRQKELEIKQAAEARRVRAEQRQAATSAELLRQLGAGARGPSTTTTPTPGVRTSTAQLPQTQIIPERLFQDPGRVQEYAGSPPLGRPQSPLTPDIQPLGQPSDIPGLYYTGPAPTAPSGAAVAPPGGGSSSGAAPQIESRVLGAEVPGPADTVTRTTTPAAPTADSDPISNSRWATGAYLSRKPLVPITGKSPRARALQVSKNARTLADAIDATTISARAMGSATWGKRQPPERVSALRAYSTTQKKAAEWFRSREGRSVFAKNPDLFAEAERDPVAFYEKYKGGAPTAPSVPAGTVLSTQPEAATRDSTAEFMPTLVTQGLKVGSSAAETAMRTPADKVAPVPMATLLNAERRKRDLKQFDDGINQLRQRAAMLARNGKNAQAMGIMAKMNALRIERARFVNLVNLAEFEISGDANIIDQIARSGGAAIRIGPTNDPLTFSVFRTAPDGTLARAGTITKDQLVQEYKMFYDQKYAERKQAELADSRKRTLELQEFKSKEEIKATIRALEKAQGAGDPTFRQDPANPGLTTVIVRGRPVYAYEIQQVEVNGAITYRPKYYKF